MDKRKAKALVIKAVETAAGNAADDLHRATVAFRNATPAQMHEEYGQSERTRAAILADYEQAASDWREALAWVRGL